MYLIIPFIPGIIAILWALINSIRRKKYKKIKASIMTRQPVPLQKNSNGKRLYIATYVYEYKGQRIEKRNDKIKTTAEDEEYIYIDDAGEIVDNANNRNAPLFVFGIMWIIAVFFVVKSNILG